TGRRSSIGSWHISSRSTPGGRGCCPSDRPSAKCRSEKGSGTFAGTARRVLRTKVPDPFSDRHLAASGRQTLSLAVLDFFLLSLFLRHRLLQRGPGLGELLLGGGLLGLDFLQQCPGFRELLLDGGLLRLELFQGTPGLGDPFRRGFLRSQRRQ